MSEPTPNPDQALKDKILKGGLSLALRQMVTSILSLVSILVVARVLGPKQYGIVAVAMGIFYFLIWSNKLGIGVYFVREQSLPENCSRHILAFYNHISLLSAVALWFLAPAIAAWTKQPETLWLVRFLALPLWLEMISDAPAMIMARELQFAEIGMIEVIAQLANYALSIPLVLTGKGYWAPVLGLTLQQLINAILFWRAQPIPFRFTWNRACMTLVLRNGLAYTGSDLIISLRALTVPLLVTHFAGVEAAGIVSITIRFAEQLSTLRQVLNQMSLSVLAKFTEQPEKIRNALSQGMVYQILLVAPACAIFSCSASWLIPLLFGGEWLMSTQVFPLVAVGVMMSATFELHVNALYAATKNRKVALFNAGFITLQWSTALVALPLFGAWGYGLAELATAPSYGLLHYNLSKLYGSPNYKNALTLIVATLPALLAGPWIPVWLGLLVLGLGYGLAIALNAELRYLLKEAFSIWQGRRA